MLACGVLSFPNAINDSRDVSDWNLGDRDVDTAVVDMSDRSSTICDGSDTRGWDVGGRIVRGVDIILGVRGRGDDSDGCMDWGWWRRLRESYLPSDLWRSVSETAQEWKPVATFCLIVRTHLQSH